MRIETRTRGSLPSSRVFVACSAFVCTIGLCASAGAAPPAADLQGFRDTVAPFFARHCSTCHGEKKQEAKLSLHTIDGDVPAGKDIETWKTIAERLALNEMPPEDQPRPDAREVERVLAWIKAELVKAGEDVADIGQKLMLPGHGNRVDHDALFSGKFTGPTASPARLWRMRPQGYVSFVPRIGGRSAKVGQPFSTHAGEGFKDYADLFVVDEPTISQLMRNAGQLVSLQCGESKFTKPLKEFEPLLDEAQPPSAEDIDAAIRKQFQLALLREPSAEELQRFRELLQKNVEEAGRRIGVKSTLAAVLMLPEAFYRYELGRGEPDEHGRVMLGSRELAYAISFALTDEAPDGTLLKAAESGQLASREDVRREVERILDDPKVDKPRIMRFFDEYFEYPAAEDVFKDLKRGQWRPEILINDTRLLIASILEQDQDVLKQLLTTNRSFVNARRDPKTGTIVEARPIKKKEPKKDKKTGKLIPVPPRDPEQEPAIHDWYSLPVDWQWTDKQPVEFPAEQRAGILTQPSWLAAFATNNENHAIRRGKWVRERLLGGVVPDLPISVDAKLPDAPEQTLRERMDITRQEYCWQCHRKMNPLGLTFEHYDFIGRYRELEPVLDVAATEKNVDKKGQPLGPVLTGVPVDARGAIEHAGDSRLNGEYPSAVDMIHRLAESPHVRQVFVRHAFRYWMGRNETLDDAPTLLAADRAYVDSGGSMRALMTSLLTSDSFLYRQHTTVESAAAR